MIGSPNLPVTRRIEEHEDSGKEHIQNHCGSDICEIEMNSECNEVLDLYIFHGKCCSLSISSSAANGSPCIVRIPIGNCSFSNTTHTITHTTNANISYCPHNGISIQEQKQGQIQAQGQEIGDQSDNENEETDILFVSESAVYSHISNAEGMILSSLPPLETARAQAAAEVTRVGSVDVFTMEEGNNVSKEVGLCHLPFLMPFSLPPGAVIPNLGIKTPYRIPMNTFRTHLAFVTSLLAAQHLNTGDGSVIPEVEGLPDKCNIRFTLESLDTYWDPATAIDHTQHVLNRQTPGDKPKPCVLVGAFRSGNSIGASILASTKNVPVFSPISQSIALDNKEQHPLFGRVCGHTAGDVNVLVRYYKEVLKVRYLGVVYINDEYGVSYVRELQDRLRDYAPAILEHIRITAFDEGNHESVELAMQFLKDTNYRYFFAASPNAKELLTAAYHAEIAGTGRHQWFFSNIATLMIRDQFGNKRKFQREEPYYQALKGVLQIASLSGVRAFPQGRYSQLVEAVAKFKESPSDKEYLKIKFPQYPDAPSDFFDFDDPTFFDVPFLEGVSITDVWAYDTIISAGLAACNVTQKEKYFDGPSHYQAMLNTEFVGASGRVVLDRKTGSRDTSSVLVAIGNYQAREESGADDVDIELTFTHMFYDNDFVATGTPFMNNNGTARILPDLFDVNVDKNYIGLGFRIYGLCLSGVVIILSLAFVGWVHKNQHERVVCASQPLFLKIICFGTFLMGLSIIPFSFDDEILNETGKSIACNAVLWLFAVGSGVSVSALFAKTWRVNKVFNSPKLRRIKVTPRDVIWPLIVVLISNIIFLSLWSGLSPLEWHRDVVSTNSFEQPIETVGTCWDVHDRAQVAFASCILVVNFIMLVLAGIQAYKARKIHLEFSETEYIAKALVISVVVCLLGIPIMVIVNDSPSTSFFVLASIFFVLPFSLLLFIFVPKILYFLKAKNTSTKKAIRSSLTNTSMSNVVGADDDIFGSASATFNKENTIGESCMAVLEIIYNKVNGMVRSEEFTMDNTDYQDETEGEDKIMDTLKVVDSPEMREAMKRENKKLKQDIEGLQILIDSWRSKNL